MEQSPSVVSKIEHVLFAFICCVNDLHLLQNDRKRLVNHTLIRENKLRYITHIFKQVGVDVVG